MSGHVVLAGGGTAGHIEPALALADALRRRDPSLRITALGTTRGLETRLVPERGYDLALIPPVPIPRRPTPDLLRVPGRLRAAVREAAAVLDRVSADVLVGFGGYVAGPAYLAARRRGVPLVVHEANVRPGLANRLGARFAAAVAVASPATQLPGARHVGMPLRRSIATLDRAARRAEARALFGLDADRPTLLAFGGSQGALRINTAVSGAAAELAAAGIQVLHATGATHEVHPERPAGAPPYVAVPYLDRMDLAYAAADLAVCRAGAMTCAELTAVGLPAVYVPLPHGNGEQVLNCTPIVQAGGGTAIRDEDLTPQALASLVIGMLEEPRLARHAEAAARLGRRDADEALADLVRGVMGAGGPPGPGSVPPGSTGKDDTP